MPWKVRDRISAVARARVRPLRFSTRVRVWWYVLVSMSIVRVGWYVLVSMSTAFPFSLCCAERIKDLESVLKDAENGDGDGDGEGRLPLSVLKKRLRAVQKHNFDITSNVSALP